MSAVCKTPDVRRHHWFFRVLRSSQTETAANAVVAASPRAYVNCPGISQCPYDGRRGAGSAFAPDGHPGLRPAGRRARG